MFENTRWSNPNYQPNYDYGQRVEAAKLGQFGLNLASQAMPLIGKGIEAYAQRKRVQDILDQMKQQDVAGGGSSITEAGNPLVTGYVPTLSDKELEELRKKYSYLYATSEQPENTFVFDYVG